MFTLKPFTNIFSAKKRRSRKGVFVHICKYVALPIFLVVTVLICTFLSRESIDTDRYTATLCVTPVMPQAMAVAAYYTSSDRVEVQEEESEVNSSENAEWYVTLDEKTDAIGNACTLFNFVAYHWDDARQWLVDNYAEDWPHGPVREDRPAIEMGPTIAMGMVANSIIECGWIPATYEKGGNIQTADDLLALGDRYNHAWGMIQWDGGRRTNFARFCKASGFDVKSLETMCYYLAYEYYASSEYSSYTKGLQPYFGDTAPTLEKVGNAAYIFRKDVERGGGRKLAIEICSGWKNKWDPRWGTKPSGGVYNLMTQYYTTGEVPLR